jgi:hypothetical protein
MARWHSVPFLLCALASCGDVPHPPKRVWVLPDGAAPLDAAVDASFDDTGSLDTSMGDGPKRPLPVSDQCLLCGSVPCFDLGAECVGDPFCQSCFADVYQPGCLQDRRFVDMGRCVCTHCYDICRDVCEPTRSVWELPDSGPPGG